MGPIWESVMESLRACAPDDAAAIRACMPRAPKPLTLEMLACLPGGKLESRLDRLCAIDSVFNKLLIAAGAGLLTPRDMDSLVAAGDTGTIARLWIEQAANATARREASWELDARKRYHGGTKPIGRPVYTEVK